MFSHFNLTVWGIWSLVCISHLIWVSSDACIGSHHHCDYTPMTMTIHHDPQPPLMLMTTTMPLTMTLTMTITGIFYSLCLLTIITASIVHSFTSMIAHVSL